MEEIKRTMITGASDDLIEIEGEIREEFSAWDCTNGVITCSDGTFLNVNYDENGIWRFKVDFKGSLFERKEEGSVEEDTNDKVFFKEGLKWIVFQENPSVALK